MNELKSEQDTIERLLRKAHLPEPSSQLHDRVTGVARQTWDRKPAEVPWQVPVRRLAISVAATFLVISAANHFSNRVTSQAQSYTGPVESVRSTSETSLDAWVEEAPYRYRLGFIQPDRTLLDSQAIRNRTKSLRRILDEMNHNGT